MSRPSSELHPEVDAAATGANIIRPTTVPNTEHLCATYDELYEQLWKEHGASKKVFYLRVGAAYYEQEIACLNGKTDVLSLRINGQGELDAFDTITDLKINNHNLRNAGLEVGFFQERNIPHRSLEDNSGIIIRVPKSSFELLNNTVKLDGHRIKCSHLTGIVYEYSNKPIAKIEKDRGLRGLREGRFKLHDALHEKFHTDALIRLIKDITSQGVIVVYEDSTISSGCGVSRCSKNMFDELKDVRGFIPICFSGYTRRICSKQSRIGLITGFRGSAENNLADDVEIDIYNDDADFLDKVLARAKPDFPTVRDRDGGIVFPGHPEYREQTAVDHTPVVDHTTVNLDVVTVDPGINPTQRREGFCARCLSGLRSLFGLRR